MPRPLGLLGTCLLTLLACDAGTRSASPPRTSGAAAAIEASHGGAPSPAPPKQGAAWSAPPSGLPAAWVSAITALFDQGLGDPRGCEYRELLLPVWSVENLGRTSTKTHGWVFPKDNELYALSASGTIYKPLFVGADASFADDVRGAIATDARERDESGGRSDVREGLTELESVTPAWLRPLAIAMALRLGDGALATEAFRAWTSDNPAQGEATDPYRMLAERWTWILFDRATTAHMRGDDALALANAEMLATILPRVEAECDRRGFARPRAPDGHALPHLAFSAVVPALVVDERRRLAAPSSRPPDAELGEVDLASRVPLLIEALDQVVALENDPIVMELVGDGATAVPALLEVLENDNRLTRSVRSHDAFGRTRSLLGTHEAALAALSGIFGRAFFQPTGPNDDFSSRGPEERRRVAAEARAVWETWRGLSNEGRWYAALADDRATKRAWVDAASAVGTPKNALLQPGFLYPAVPLVPRGEAPKTLGEALRTKSAPSVSELFERRIESLAADPATACSLTIAFATWDPARSLPFLEKQMTRTLAATDVVGGNECITALTIFRAETGDLAALGPYATWIGSFDPASLKWSASSYLEPMWRFPDDPAIVKASSAMFRGAGSVDRADLVRTPLLRVKAFREHVARALRDKSEIGKTTVIAADAVSIAFTNGGSSTMSTGKGPDRDPAMPKDGTVVVTRVADYYALLLKAHRDHDYRKVVARLLGRVKLAAKQPAPPDFELYWPETRRDDALAAAIRFVEAFR